MRRPVADGIEYDDPWLFVNGEKFGFRMVDDENRKIVVCHRKRVGRYKKEFGFYVPAYFVLKRARLLFEVKLRRKSKPDSYVHYIFDPKKGTRMIPNTPHVFLSVNRMETTDNAVHISRRRLP